MHASTPSNPTYKKRLITAMLDEPELVGAARSASNSQGTWSPKVVLMVAGLSFLSAVCVFLLLYHHDNSAFVSTGPFTAFVGERQSQSKAAPSSAVAETGGDGAARIAQSEAKAVSSSSLPVSADSDIAVPEPVEFAIKRSRTFQRVGAIGLRLLRVNPRRRTCDVVIQWQGRRSLQKRLQLNRPLQFKPAASADPWQITVSSISRDSISGILSTLSGPIGAAKVVAIR